MAHDQLLPATPAGTVDPLSPVSPSRIRALLIPCGKIKRSRFLTFVSRCKDAASIPLRDVSPGKPHRSMFSPAAFPNGVVFYDMSTSNPSTAPRNLSPFELYREPLAIIAIADGIEGVGQGDNMGTTKADIQQHEAGNSRHQRYIDELAGCLTLLKETHTSALVHQVFIFDYEISEPVLPPSMVAVPSIQQSNAATIKPILCDLTSVLLSEMTSYAKSLQAINIETPKVPQSESSIGDYYATRLLNMTNPSPAPRSPDKHGTRASLPVNLLTAKPSDLSTESEDPTSPSDGASNPSVTFDQIGTLPGRLAPFTSLEKARESSSDRVAVDGFGSNSSGERYRAKNKARMGILLGSMYLLSGRWPDAIKELSEATTAARASSDHVWHAKGLDYILVSILMCAWAGIEFEIPQICYPLGEKKTTTPARSTKHTPTGSLPNIAASKTLEETGHAASLQSLCTLLPDLINNILHLYVRAATFTADQLPQIAFSESTIRLSKLLAIVEASHGILDVSGLRSIVSNVEFVAPIIPLSSQAVPFPTKSDIATILFRAIPSQGSERSMNVAERVSIFAGIASVLAKLGYHRKKAFILRELLNLLLPTLIQSRKEIAAELGVHPAASLPSYDLTDIDIGFPSVSGKNGWSNSGLQSFLELICGVYGVILAEESASTSIKKMELSSSYDNVAEYDTIDVITNRVVNRSVTRSFGNQALKFDVLRSCINICEALPDLRGIIRFSGDFLSTGGSGTAPGPNDREGSSSIPIEDQMRLSNNVSRTVSAARQLGMDRAEAEYWDEFLVRDIEVVMPFSSNVPIPRAKTQLDVTGFTGPEKTEGPFIYNPFMSKPTSAVAEPVLIAEEAAVFKLLLQNLYDFDVEIEWIKLDTLGMDIDTLAQSIIIGPYRTHSVQLLGTPKSAGQLTVIGCIAKINGCRPRRFPLFQKPWKDQQDGKMKHLGLMALKRSRHRPVSVASDPSRILEDLGMRPPAPSTLILNVIEAQPIVIVKHTSLFQSAIMTLEGETKNFTITLQNTSSNTPVDLLLLSFSDSTSAVLQSLVTNKDLSVAEIYEAEISSYKRPPFRLRRTELDQAIVIAAGGELILEIEVYGKPGLTHGAIHIDYSHLGVPKSKVKDRFYTRQISFPFAVTVNSSIDLIRNDLLPFTGELALPQNHGRISSQESPNTTLDIIQSSRKAANASPFVLDRLDFGTSSDDQCLVLLDFHNAWPGPLSLCVQVREKPRKDSSEDGWDTAYTVHEILQPGYTSRLVLLLPRISLEHQHSPIPSLNPATKRQFILSASRLSPDVERTARAAFWYREEILNHMRASWEEESTKRHGEIDLRALRFTPRMIDAIKLEELGIEISISTPSVFSSAPSSPITPHPTSTFSQPLQQLGRARFLVSTDTFVTLTTRITNRLSQPIYPLLRLQPALRNQPYNIALDLAKRFAFNGVLQRALPILAAGESHEITLGCVFLCAGEFEIAASVEEVRVWDSGPEKVGEGGSRKRAETGDIGTAIGEVPERRVWYAREVCEVDAVDGDIGSSNGEVF